MTEQIFDIIEYMGFKIRDEKVKIFEKMKQMKRTQRLKNHRNKYIAIKETIKRKLYMFIRSNLKRLENK